jgi:DNA-directed RNA polymerase specialized sigma24 family protein
MTPQGSVTHWLALLEEGDEGAAQRLWERYFSRLVALARSRLWGANRREADEEDVALSAFASLCAGVQAGRFPQLADRQGLWRLLVVITARKALDLRAYQNRKIRHPPDPGRPRPERPVYSLAHQGAQGLEAVIGLEPSPEFAAQVAEECQRLLGALDTPTLREIAVAKMEGYTNEEIAARLGRSLSAVERKLRLIRRAWDSAGEPGPE